MFKITGCRCFLFLGAAICLHLIHTIWPAKVLGQEPDIETHSSAIADQSEPGKSDRSPYYREIQTVVSVSLDGTSRVESVECISIADFAATYSMLRQEDVRRELLFDANTNDKIDEILRIADAHRADLRKRLWAGQKQADDETNDWFSEKLDEVAAEFERAISSDKKSRLKQIRRRLDFRAKGLFEALGKFEIDEQIRWEPEEGEAKAIRDCASELLTYVRAECLEQHSRELERLFGIFNDRQSEILRQYARGLAEPTGNLDLFRVQMQIKEVEPTSESSGSLEEIFQKIGHPAYYVLGQDGQLQQIGAMRFQDSVRCNRLEWQEDMLRAIIFGDLAATVALNDDQKSVILDSLIALSAEREKAEKYFLENSSTNPVLQLEIMADLQHAALLRNRKAVSSVLNQTQIRQLANYARICDVAKSPLMTQLINGKIGNELELSPVQRDDLRKFSIESKSRIDDFCRKLENHCLDQLVDKFRPRSGASFQSIFGEPLEQMSCSVLQLEGGLNRTVAGSK